MNNKKYTWNENRTDEIWQHGRFDSIEECIEDAIAEGKENGDTIAIGICEDYIPRIDAGNLLDLVAEDAYEECGEAAEGWPEFSTRQGYEKQDELQDAIDKVFNEWLKETNQVPGFYHIHPCTDMITIQE